MADQGLRPAPIAVCCSSITVPRGDQPQRIAVRNLPLQIIKEGVGLARVCGVGVGLAFFATILANFRTCARARNLNPVGEAMGPGPFHCNLRGAKARLTGPDIISSIREIWVRDVYTGGGFLEIPKDATVVDLGSNRGVFSALALAHGTGVRVTAVEVDPKYTQNRAEILALNGWAERLRLVPAFIGPRSPLTDKLVESIRQSGHPCDMLSEDEFIQAAGLTHIDFLKCDIEGSEYGLLHKHSKLLAMTDRLGIELHTNAGDAEAFITMLHELGFETKVVHRIANTILLNAKRKTLRSR